VSIIAITGRPRSGKTYLAVRMLVLFYLNRGVPVWSNIKINWEGHEYRKWSWKKFKFEKVVIPKSNLRYWDKVTDLFSISGGVIFMDEMHVYMNSRKWKDLPEEMQWKLHQHGKDRLDILGTVQHINRMDVIVRELVDFWYVVSRFPRARSAYNVARPILFRMREYDIDMDRKMLNPIGWPNIYFVRKKWFNMYDTMQKIRA